MAQKDPTQVANKWATNLGQSTTSIQAGVQAVTTAPGVKAAAQANVWANNTVAAKQKWATNTAKVPLSDWQDSMINKGIPRIQTGATAAVPKMTAFLTKSLPFINNLVATLPPRGDLGSNINRAVAFMNGMSKFSNS